MASVAPPVLRLQPKHTNRPYGGGWWPSGTGPSHELLDLVGLWPADRPPILRYSYIRDDWDQAESTVKTGNRTRTLVLCLADRSTCRLLMIPTATPPDVAAEFLAEASDPTSHWTRMDFASTYRSDVTPADGR